MDETRGNNGYILEASCDKCKACGSCERLVPGFKTVYNGRVLVSKASYSIEEVFESVRSIIDACPVNAIDISKV